jgi:serine phosphatase RsbU (regulator of sigma subunit)
MINPFRSGGFEKRILILFLVISLAPTIAIAIFGTRYFAGYVDRLSNVALRESFRNSMEIARDYSARLERDAPMAAIQTSAALGRRPTETELRRHMEEAAARHQVDFIALYVREEGVWSLAGSLPPGLERISRIAEVGTEVRHDGSHKVTFADQDVVAGGVPHGDEALLVSGHLLEPGMLDMMRKTGEDFSRYSSVGLYVSVLRRYTIIVISVLAVILAVASAVASRLLAKRVSYPIQELATATDRIAQGDLSHRVEVNAKDEIGSLVSSFNNMTQELQENKERIIAMATREAQVARDFEIARAVQQNLFPEALPGEEGWDFAARCRPAKAVGGDYYDIFEVSPGRVLFAQGDVSGKGLGASLVMASVHAIIRSWGGDSRDNPAHLIEELNQYLVTASSSDTFVTMFIGLLDCAKGKLWYVNCGHPPALLHRSGNGDIENLSLGGMPLGIIEATGYEAGSCRVADGDAVVLVSDGVTEAVNREGGMFEEKRLVETVIASRDLTAGQTLERVIEEVDAFSQGCEQADDISVLVIRKNP